MVCVFYDIPKVIRNYSAIARSIDKNFSSIETLALFVRLP